jgi:integrase
MYLFCTRKGQPYIKVDKSVNAFQSMWQRWQNKALKQTKLIREFSEKSLRNRTASDMETAEKAAELLGHASTDTTRKHYRNAPVKVTLFLR